ncbi:MAG: Xaa-Pro aminopeptidase [Verrucomicrobiales bacterium]|nr:Xaa-Pro aminopeptidase [Verrucomicrobiales bacterium]|tara:strand:- start:1123 stop:2253 length:1131 start_codon:yes stop_codon:yes gene_type:complete
MPSENLLLIADSEKDADMLYATGLFVPDPFIYLRLRGRHYIVMSDLEFDRAKRLAPHCRVLSLSEYAEKAKGHGAREVPLVEVVAVVLKERKIRSVTVPGSFPHGLAVKLEKLGVRVKASRGPIFPQREFKTPDEIRKVKAAVAMTEVGMSEAIQTLRRSRIDKGGRLIYRNATLTSEKLQAIIGAAVLTAGGIAANTIVACGNQGTDPHERGHGPLKAHSPIIIDIFPRAEKTGYFGDITRTVVRGRASERVREMYAAVLKAQEVAMSKIRAGVSMVGAHQAVVDHFESGGWFSGRRNGHMEGFFHGTGHGLGLEIHEMPRIGAGSKAKFRPGQILTVEPGLYYPGVGGVRLEDDILVTKGRPRNLTRCEKVLEV